MTFERPGAWPCERYRKRTLFPLSLFPCPGTSMVRLEPPRSLPPIAAQCVLGAGCRRLKAHWGGRFVGEQRAGRRGRRP
jgi:hypothetical protein